MHKTRQQIWTRLSKLPKEIPVWLKGSSVSRPAANQDQQLSLPATDLAPSDVHDQNQKNQNLKALNTLTTNLQAIEDVNSSTCSDFASAADTGHIDDTLIAEMTLSKASDTTKEMAHELETSLLIPVCTECPDIQNRQALQNQGQFLARQERWTELSKLIRTADQKRRNTAGGLPEADLLAFGARADVVNAVEHALEEADTKGTQPWDNRILIDGIMALEALRREHRFDSYLTALVALAHIDIAWIWRGAAADTQDGDTYLRRAAAHFERAATLMTPLEADSCESVFLSATRCALYAGQTEDTLRVADAYGSLIDQAPSNPRHMRALGTQMLPRANGSYAALELEARRTSVRTQDEWGCGGYTWVYFDAMALDEQACARVDPQFFLDGLQDILCANPSQEMVNLLAAYCGVTLRQGLGTNKQADITRNKISAASRWLIRSHLHELHPLVWAHAAEGFDNNVRVTSRRRFAARGKAEAMQCIAGIFRDEIDSGHKIAFSPKGFDLVRGEERVC